MPIHRICVVAIVAVLLLVQPAAASTDLLVLRDKNSGLVFAVQPYEYDNLGGEATEKAAVVPPLTATTPRGIADQFIAACKDSLGVLDPAAQLRHEKTWTDKLGISHVSYSQHHEGVPVYLGEITVHLTPTNAIKYVNVKVPRDLPDTTPALAASQATAIALARSYEDIPAGFTPYTGDATLEILPLGIVKNSATEPTILAWRVPVFDDPEHPIFAQDYLVNAHSGEIAIAFTKIAEIDRQVPDCATASGDGNCRVNWQNLLYPGYYHGITEDSALPLPRGPHPDANMSYYYGSNDVDNMYTYLGAMRDFTYETFGTDGANGQGGTSTNMTDRTVGFTHYDPSGHPFCPYSGGIYFDSADIFGCRGAVTPDFVGHEYGHAIERFLYSGWPVYWGERGAISEAFSDVVGQAFEAWYTGNGDWQIGTGHDFGVIFRDLANPRVWGYNCDECDCTAYGYPPNLCPMPDSYTSPFLFCGNHDNGGVHHNATVIGHAFYTMAEGDSRNCDVSPIGIDAAVQVFYRALQANYISMSGSFNEAYYAFILAAQDIYNGDVVANVGKSLESVQLNHIGRCQGGGDPGPDCMQRSLEHVITCDASRNEKLYYFEGDTLYVYAWGGVPGRNVQFKFMAHLDTIPPYNPISGGVIVPATVGEDGTVFVQFPRLPYGTYVSYDLIMNGNSDYHWQEWADIRTVFYMPDYPSPIPSVPPGYDAEIKLYSNSPNPFNPQTTLRFDLPDDSAVTLSVFDLRGGLVRLLVAETLPRGRHEAVWDGSDAGGRAMPSGTYFARLEAGGKVETVRMSLVR